MARPFLRWAGSKRQLVPTLARFWGERHSRYVEPFAGSACLYFHLSPAKALLGDINVQLMEVYRCVRDEPAELSEEVCAFSSGRDEFLRIRALDPSTLSSIERAARFLYLNRYCFNGLYRTNLKGQFNVPYGGGKSGSLPSADDLHAWSIHLASAELVVGDFEQTLRQVTKGDFVYMDPPFRVAARRTFRQYDPASFSDSDLVRLRTWMLDLAEQGVSFLVSYAESEEAHGLAEGFRTARVHVRRNIAGFSSKRVRGTEVLIVSPDLEARLDD